MRTKLFSVLSIITIGISFCSCATTHRSMSVQEQEAYIKQQVLGEHKSNVIAVFGKPTYSTSDGKGGEIVVFDQSKSAYMPYSQVYMTIIHRNTFFINSSGYVYDFKYVQIQQTY